MNETKATALHFVRNGFWPVMLRPLSADPENDHQRGKRPAKPGWGLIRPTESYLAFEYDRVPDRGVGLRLGPEGGLVDIDVDDPDLAREPLRELFGDTKPSTLSWSTSRGFHLLFRWDGRLEALGAERAVWLEFPGIDLRLGGRGKQVYATIPPSPLADGQPRRWDRWPAELAELPERAVALILERCRLRPPRPPRDPAAIEQGWHDRERRALAWLGSRPPAISGCKGRPHFWNTLCCLKGFASNPSELASLADAFNATCDPPFCDREIDLTVERVDRVYGEPYGFKLHDPERDAAWLDRSRNRRQSRSLRVVGDSEGPGRIEFVKPLVAVDDENWELTDVGNARRFAAEHAGEVRYCPSMGGWLVWDGCRFAQDQRQATLNLGIESSRRWFAAAETPAQVRWHKESQSRSRIEAFLKLAQALPGVAIDAAELDADPWIINTLSGIVDLRTGLVRPHDPEALCSRLAPVRYDPDAESQEFETFLSQITIDNPVLIDYLRRLAGYCLTGSTREQQFWTFWGDGRNGKGALLEMWLACMGDYACSTAGDLFLIKDFAQHPTSLMELEGRRLVFTDEMNDGGKLDEGLVKRLTGGLPIKARRMRQDEQEFTPKCKIVLLTNEKPQIHGTDAAIWDRLRLVRYPVRFAAEPEPVNPPYVLRKDLGLVDRLKTNHREAIFAWMVRGCLDWGREGLAAPPVVQEATNAYRQEQNRVANFLREHCDIGPRYEAKGGELYRLYREWCKENGFRSKSNAGFSTELERLGLRKRESNAGSHWQGITVRTQF